MCIRDRCGHCEATVKKALEALPEVTSAEVSHEAGTAVVTLSSEVADDVEVYKRQPTCRSDSGIGCASVSMEAVPA